MAIHVLIADDHLLIREGLKRALARHPDIRCVAETGDAAEIPGLIRRHSPDVVLLDLSMPGVRFPETVSTLAAADGAPKIVMLSMHSARQFGVHALRAGAAGYVSKDQDPEEVIVAVRRVVMDQRYVSPELATRLAQLATDPGALPGYERLSSREMQVLRLTAQGRRATDIANDLGLSRKTISTYRRRICTKLGLENTTEMIRYALEEDLVSTETT